MFSVIFSFNAMRHKKNLFFFIIMFIYKMDQDKVNMIVMALLAVNIILGLICVFKKGSEEEEFAPTTRKTIVAGSKKSM